MVATRLWEVTAKGTEWANSGGSSSSSSIYTTHSTNSTNANATAAPPSTVSSAATATAAAPDNVAWWDFSALSPLSLLQNSTTASSAMMGSIVSSFYGGGCGGYAVSHTTIAAAAAAPKNFNPQPGNNKNNTVPSLYQQPFWNRSAGGGGDDDDEDTLRGENNDDDDDDDDGTIFRLRIPLPATAAAAAHRPHRRHGSNTTANSMTAATPILTGNNFSDLFWMFRHNKNPYNAVRGRDTYYPSSLTAVRSLVALVPSQSRGLGHSPSLVDDKDNVPQEQQQQPTPIIDTINTTHLENKAPSLTVVLPTPTTSAPSSSTLQLSPLGSLQLPEATTTTNAALVVPPPPYEFTRDDHSLLVRTAAADATPFTTITSTTTPSDSETASQLAEGSIRALRDLALEEAVELQAALRFWNNRWERPLLSWLEAGPMVWASEQGYNHQDIGQKVSQIQAVLARRCAGVGELQQHLLRAGWHRGVAQWGVLGQGGQWAPVTGFDGTIRDNPFRSTDVQKVADTSEHLVEPFSPEFNARKSSDEYLLRPFPDETVLRQGSTTEGATTSDIAYHFPGSSAHIGGSDSLDRTCIGARSTAQARVFVGKKHGEGIFVDDPAFLAEWSVDAMKLVRRYLYRTGNGRIPIPGEQNWIERGHRAAATAEDTSRNRKLPLWASDAIDSTISLLDGETNPSTSNEARVKISNLSLMVSEVCELLDVMEDMMAVQRRRRLDLFRPPSWLRCNWYVIAAVAPPLTFLGGRLITKGYGRKVISLFAERVTEFFRERVVHPVAAIFQEIWRGRESCSDQKARLEAIESLKKMIRSWLDDTFPEMPESERLNMAEAMDVSMVEKKKEESMKTFYEINNVIRMSFIEMQYMKKEMMNALHAMDDMMSANDINMNLAAITPAALLLYGSTRVFRFFFYAFLKLGKSREETYASFRGVLTDIERLLVMRDNPPSPPPSYYELREQTGTTPNRPCVLGSDDLGMLMLLVHECRSILWRDRKRFTEAVIRSVAEDLAELAGERGAVSVQQQLYIVGRMCRTYPFLKVVSTGHLFQYDGLRHV